MGSQSRVFRRNPEIDRRRAEKQRILDLERKMLTAEYYQRLEERENDRLASHGRKSDEETLEMFRRAVREILVSLPAASKRRITPEVKNFLGITEEQ